MTQPFGEGEKQFGAASWLKGAWHAQRWIGMTRNLHLWDGFVKMRANKPEPTTAEEVYEDSEALTEVSDPYDAEIVSSAVKKTGLAGSGLDGFFQPQPVGYNVKHKLLVDIDYPVVAIDSSTPGHSHLYIDKELTWDQVQKVLDVLAEVGLVEEGYVAASKRRGVTHLRVPWLKKITQPNGRYV
ncbi:hypothetical protein GS540_26565 [Rhodococcus hoagii]|nr:hypothetical protein [Prescottella equi]